MMIDILRDPIWQFIGAILALAAILISVAIYFLQRRQKALKYEILANSPLLTTQESNLGNLVILHDGIPIEQPHVIFVHVTNSGNEPIVPDDYEEPISFTIEPNARMISAAITSASPTNLRPDTEFVDNSLVVKPLLLNPTDTFTLKVLIDGESEIVEARSRIRGVTGIGKSIPYYLPYVIPMAVGYLIVGASVFLSPPSAEALTDLSTQDVGFFALIALGTALIVIPYRRLIKRSRKLSQLRQLPIWLLKESLTKNSSGRAKGARR